MAHIKEDLKYTKEHEWFALDGDIGTIGITDFAQGELGDVVYVELPEIGANFRVGEPFGTIEAVKAVAELFAPVAGTIVEVNERLKDAAEVVNSDCYGDGWMIKIRLSDPVEADELLTAKDYGDLTATA